MFPGLVRTDLRVRQAELLRDGSYGRALQDDERSLRRQLGATVQWLLAQTRVEVLGALVAVMMRGLLQR
ncbi:MAG: hypothetical protein JXA74_12760 [Anaerolineae bacterium]|nr:hypothetical protein [Anaerolineae bacterium]